jgi:hypothetical protein
MQQLVADDRMHIINLTAQVRRVIDLSEISAASFHQTLAAMDEQQDALELEHVGDQARIDAIRAAIAHTADQASQKAADDPTVVELSKVVDAREHALEMVKTAHGQGFGSESEVADAEAAAAEARAQVDLRRESVYAANGGDVVTALNKELIDLQIAQSECVAKARFVHDQCDKMRDISEEVDLLDDMQRKLKSDEADADPWQQKVDQLQQMLPPTANPAASAPSP